MKNNDTSKQNEATDHKAHHTGQRIITAAVAVVFAAIGGVYVWQKLPASVKNPPPAPTNPSAPVIGGTTAPTRETTPAEGALIPTETENWCSTEETVIWNDCYSFTFTEPPKVSKTLPTAFIDEDVRYSDYYSEQADENGTLISDHVYVDCSMQVSFLQEKELMLNGLPMSEDGFFTAASQNITVYDRTTKHFIESDDNRAAIMLVNGKRTDYHCSARLAVGDTVDLHLLYTIPSDVWNDPDKAVLMTLQHGIYNTDSLLQIGYTQPHFLLNTAPFAAE